MYIFKKVNVGFMLQIAVNSGALDLKKATDCGSIANIMLELRK